MTVLTLLAPAGVRAAGPETYYFIAVRNGAYNFKGGETQLEESYKALRGMVKLADGQSVRLTLLFSAQYALYISSDPARLAELEGWKKTGHEVGAYHQGPDTPAWDGYSDLPEEELGRLRKEDRKGRAVPGHADYFSALARLTPELKTGCMPGKADKAFLAAAPAYEICAVPWVKGANRSLFLVTGGEKVRKRLSSFNPSDKAGIEAAGKYFNVLSSGVYGASFKSVPAEFGAFYAWLTFLRGKDPEGLRSRTVAAVIESGLLAKQEARGPAPVAEPAAKKVKSGGKPGTGTPKREAGERELRKPEPPVPEAGMAEIPRLKPLPYNYGKIGSLVPEKFLRKKFMRQDGYCGDGICDAFERARPGLCSRDCSLIK